MPFNQKDFDGDSKTAKLSGWLKGINTVDERVDLEDDELFAAENIILDRKGKVRGIREGYTQVISAVSPHSLWSNGRLLLFSEGGSIKSINTEGYGTTTLYSGLTPTVKVSFVDINGVVYWSNGERSGRIYSSLSYDNGAPEAPSLAPNAEIVSGTIPEGKYQYTITSVMATGEESGAPETKTITLPRNSGIRLYDIPMHSGSYTRVYLSSANNEELFLQVTIPSAYNEVSLTTFSYGIRLEGLLLDKFPHCDLLQYYRGRLYGAKGDVVYFSEPLQYGQIRMASNFIPFGDEVTIIAPVMDGLFIGTKSSTYFISGDSPDKFSLINTSHFGSIKGTLVMIDASLFGIEAAGKLPYWFIETGGVIGLPGGQLKKVHENRVAMDKFTEGSSLFKRSHGVNQVISALRGNTERGGFRMKEVVTVNVFRNGVAI